MFFAGIFEKQHHVDFYHYHNLSRVAFSVRPEPVEG